MPFLTILSSLLFSFMVICLVSTLAVGIISLLFLETQNHLFLLRFSNVLHTRQEWEAGSADRCRGKQQTKDMSTWAFSSRGLFSSLDIFKVCLFYSNFYCGNFFCVSWIITICFSSCFGILIRGRSHVRQPLKGEFSVFSALGACVLSSRPCVSAGRGRLPSLVWHRPHRYDPRSSSAVRFRFASIRIILGN